MTEKCRVCVSFVSATIGHIGNYKAPALVTFGTMSNFLAIGLCKKTDLTGKKLNLQLW